MREVTIKLGDREFTVPQLTIRDESRWRKQAEDALSPLWDALGLIDATFSSPDDLRKLMAQIGGVLDPMAALDAICAYAPQLAAEREWIEANTYTDEVLGTLVQLFFGQLRQLERLPQTLNGSLPKPTQTISRS